MEDETREAQSAAHAAEPEPPEPPASSGIPALPPRVGFWRWLAWTLLFSVLGAVIAVAAVFFQAPPPPSMGGTASLRSPTDPGVFAFQIDKPHQKMTVFANVAPPPPGKDFELWLLAPGSTPISLGIFKPGIRDERMLLPKIGRILSSGAPLKVTIEPAGGAPGGSPTGPVAFHGYFTLMKEPVNDVR
jgi:anti-sigma-K factor RskA